MLWWFGTSRACAAVLSSSLWLCALAGCGESTQTVGHLKARATTDVPKGSTTATGGMAASESGGAGGGKPDEGDGATSSPSADGGTIVEAHDAGPPLTSPFAECKGPVAYADRRELALYFMVDNNLTFPTVTAWGNLQQGLRRYITDPRAAGTGLGIDYFGLQCDEATYANPAVQIATLPDNGPALIESFAQIPLNSSPMYPAIKGALTYARAQADANPALELAVVLITDGIADLNCDSNIDNLTQATSDGAEGSPSIPTYIVAVDTTMDSVDVFNRGARFDPLEDMAVAGGTGAVRHVDVLSEPTILSGTSMPSPTADALVALQREAEPCDYTVPDDVPDDASGAWFTRNDATAVRMLRVDSEDDCTGATDYYFAAERGVRWARLCDDACSYAKDQRPSFSWVKGCP
jgi:hypothetical protein